MDGVMKMGIAAKTGGVCAGKQDDAASANTVICKCPEVRNFICTTEIVSTANAHTITCNNMASTTIACGSDLKGTKILLAGLLSIEKEKHKLCSTKKYTSILTDYEWKCMDPSVPLATSPACPGDTIVTPTEAVTTTADTTSLGTTV
jgi:hypothetical protein